MTSSEPKLSVVVAARNDTHGGNFLERVQIFMSNLIEQCDRYNLGCELIIVEWNPPQGRHDLSRALEFPRNLKSCRIRIIQVPSAIHKRLNYAERLPMYQMIAKNVGIRRAKGKWVLSSNADILFSDELIQFLASNKLDPSKMYRVNRYDVPPKVPLGASEQQRISYCERHIMRILTRYGDIVKNKRTRSWRSRCITGPTVRLPATLYFFIEDVSKHCGVLLKSRRKRPRLKMFTTATTKIMRRVKRHLPYLLPPYALLHTNACGDFTLMTRESWFSLRGYPELDMYSLHIDSVLLHMAYNLGVNERELKDPMRIYHMDHSFGWTGQESRTTAILTERGVPVLTFRQLEKWAAKMYQRRRPMAFNDENWGLALEILSETTTNNRSQ